MAIINIPEDQLQNKFLEACFIIAKMRHFKKIWDQQYGSHNREKLRTWEQNADQFLKELDIELSPEETRFFKTKQP